MTAVYPVFMFFLPANPIRCALISMSARSKPRTAAAKKDARPRLLALRLTDLFRPNYDALIDKMKAEGVDVQLPKRSMITGLWKAVRRRKGYMWMLRTGKDVYIGRYSSTPTVGRDNPLAKHYKRRYRTAHGYMHWRDKVEQLKQGKVLRFPSKAKANLFTISARYYLKKEPNLPPHTVSRVEVETGFEVSLKWKQPPSSRPT